MNIFNKFANGIERYQTLIAGTLAVFAAYIGVEAIYEQISAQNLKAQQDMEIIQIQIAEQRKLIKERRDFEKVEKLQQQADLKELVLFEFGDIISALETQLRSYMRNGYINRIVYQRGATDTFRTELLSLGPSLAACIFSTNRDLSVFENNPIYFDESQPDIIKTKAATLLAHITTAASSCRHDISKDEPYEKVICNMIDHTANLMKQLPKSISMEWFYTCKK